MRDATNLEIDPKLIDEAVKAGGYRTKKEAVTAALEEFVRRRKQAEIIDLFGTIDFDSSYDYRTERQRKRRSIPKGPPQHGSRKIQRKRSSG